jgi:hypothetical protein
MYPSASILGVNIPVSHMVGCEGVYRGYIALQTSYMMAVDITSRFIIQEPTHYYHQFKNSILSPCASKRKQPTTAAIPSKAKTNVIMHASMEKTRAWEPSASTGLVRATAKAAPTIAIGRPNGVGMRGLLAIVLGHQITGLKYIWKCSACRYLLIEWIKLLTCLASRQVDNMIWIEQKHAVADITMPGTAVIVADLSTGLEGATNNALNAVEGEEGDGLTTEPIGAKDSHLGATILEKCTTVRCRIWGRVVPHEPILRFLASDVARY